MTRLTLDADAGWEGFWRRLQIGAGALWETVHTNGFILLISINRLF